MKQSRKPLWIAIISLAVCILSAVIVSENVFGLMGEGWESLSRAVWVTVLVTLPAFAIFCAFGVLALITWLKGLRSKGAR